jgi:hypothetical protein
MPGLTVEENVQHYDKYQPEFGAIADPLNANVDPAKAVELSLKLSRMAREHIMLLNETFKQAMEDEVVTVGDKARAYWVADARFVNAESAQAAGIRQELYAAAGPMEERGAQVLAAIAPTDPKVDALLAKIRPGTGYRDRANDCQALYVALTDRQERVVGSGLMTEAEIKKLGEIGDKLVQPIAVETSAGKQAETTCNQAFTYFIRAWKYLAGRLQLISDEHSLGLDIPSLYR